MAGKNPAIYIGASHTRQRVVRVAAFEPGGDAGSADPRVVIRNSGKPGEGRWLRRRGKNGFHIGADRAADNGRFAREIFAGDFVEFERKLVAFQAGQAVSELVDGVFRSGQRAVATRIGNFQIEILVELFAGLNAEQQALALVEFEIAGVGIDDVFGVDEIAVIFDQPVDAVRFPAFFIGG